MPSQKFEALLGYPDADTPMTNVTMLFDAHKPWEDVWTEVENAAKTLGYSWVCAMRASEPLSTAWMPQHLFDRHAKTNAQAKSRQKN